LPQRLSAPARFEVSIRNLPIELARKLAYPRVVKQMSAFSASSS
jgi:hypothetical protein